MIVRKHIDLASWFAAGGGLLIVAAVALSLWWNRTRSAEPDGRRIG
jgi:Ca-activated chloride channel family protein